MLCPLALESVAPQLTTAPPTPQSFSNFSKCFPLTRNFRSKIVDLRVLICQQHFPHVRPPQIFVEHADLPEKEAPQSFVQRVESTLHQWWRTFVFTAEGVGDESQITNIDDSQKPLLPRKIVSRTKSRTQNDESKYKAFKLLRVRNRFDDRLKSDTPEKKFGHLVGNYRDFAIKIEVGFETSPGLGFRVWV